MTPEIPHLLSYLRQPLVGAFTGYVTTDVAIRLLFHPLKPWHLFGVRVPLTPGVFPAKRYEFAEKVGIMVGKHLFTSEDVRQALEKEEFQRELRGAVDERIAKLFTIELGTIESLFPVDLQRWVRDMVDRLRHGAVDELYGYLESESCDTEVRRIVGQMGAALLSRDLHSFLTPEQHARLRERLGTTVRQFLHSREVASALAATVDRKVEELIRCPTPLATFLPKGVEEELGHGLERELKNAAESLMAREEFRELLSRKMKDSFKAAIASLHGVSGFLAKLVDPDWLLSLFPEVSKKIEEEVASWLRDEKTQREIAAALHQRVSLFLERPVSDLFSFLPYRKVAALRRLARRRVLRAVRGPQLGASLSDAIAGVLEGYQERTLGAVLAEVLSEEGVDRAMQEIADEVLAALRSPVGRQALEETVSEKVEELLFSRPIGHLSAFIPVTGRDELADVLCRQLAELLVKELPPLVDTLNIRKIVEDKVNALDIVEMEGLLLDIMKESFMFLNLFGAFLGFLIGVLNVIVPGWGG